MGSDMDNSSVVKGKSMTNTIGVRKRIGKIRQKRNVGKSPIPSPSGGVDDDNVTSRQKAECWEHFTIYYTKEGKKEVNVIIVGLRILVRLVVGVGLVT
ncbi:hypothetical protein ACOSQ2_030989 [Xanthoceras sorbifolium]